jgi:hypothetical protein
MCIEQLSKWTVNRFATTVNLRHGPELQLVTECRIAPALLQSIQYHIQLLRADQTEMGTEKSAAFPDSRSAAP